jgi:hypothetical protein
MWFPLSRRAFTERLIEEKNTRYILVRQEGKERAPKGPLFFVLRGQKAVFYNKGILFSFVKEQKDIELFRRTLNEHVVACAVGKVAQEALQEEGITGVIAPKPERMGAMIVTLSQYFERQLQR